MKKALKIVGWMAAAIVGLLSYYAFPDIQYYIAVGVTSVFVYAIIRELIEATIERVLRDELLELRTQSNAIVDRLELIDRKVSALLSDALDQRRQRNLRAK